MQSPSLLSLITHGSSSLSLSPLSSALTPSVFHSRLKTYLFHKSFHYKLFFHLLDWFYRLGPFSGLFAHRSFGFFSNLNQISFICDTVYNIRNTAIVKQTCQQDIKAGKIRDWHVPIYTRCFIKNTHFCFLLYLLGKWSNLYKNFSRHSWVNLDVTCVQLFQIVFLVSTT